jgi:hypothetical protein
MHFTVRGTFLIFNKFEPDKIETFCFLPLKANIHGFTAAKFVE